MRSMRGRNTSVRMWPITGAQLVLDRIFGRVHMISHCSFSFSLTKWYNDTNRLCPPQSYDMLLWHVRRLGQLVFQLFRGL